MSLETWMRLEEFKAQIEKDFPPEEESKKMVCAQCPELPRVHLVYAHYAARPRLKKNVDDVWEPPFVTLKEYKKSWPERKERMWRSAALDFLGSHFHWVLTKDVKIVKLPQPPTVLPVAPTAIDGGTLVHFQGTNFPDQNKAADAAVTGKGKSTGEKQGQTVYAKITTPLYIQDKSLIHLHGDFVREVPHPPEKKKPEPAKPPGAAKKPDAAKPPEPAKPPEAAKKPDPPKAKQVKLDPPAHPAPPPPPLPDVEGATYYPKLRRLCLSQLGKTGDHKVVDAGAATVTTEDLIYHQPQEDTALRELCIAPWFNFALLSGADSTAREATLAKGEIPKGPASVLGNPAADPWKDTTRNLEKGKRLWETTSNVYCGTIKGSGKYDTGSGIDKSVEAITETGNLGDRFIDKIGRSRWLIFKAMSKIEGRCESIQTWDGDKLSWGINQWTADGELWQVLAYIYDFFPDAFARRFGYFGLGVWFSGRKWTWTPGVYQGVVPYRVPCCGAKDLRGGHDAVLVKAIKAKAPKSYTADLPPWREKELADAFRIPRHDSTSYAMCYLFTTAGADPEIQRAMAQWMSFRISSVKPRGAPISKVLGLFLKSLWTGIPDYLHLPRYVKALATLAGRDGQSAEPQAAHELPDLKHEPVPDLKTAKTDDERKAIKAKLAENTAADRKRIVDRSNRAVELLTVVLEDIMDEPFTDDDADEAWCYWPTRLRDAGKLGIGTEDKNLTDTSAAESTKKADDDKGPTKPAVTKPAATTPAKPAATTPAKPAATKPAGTTPAAKAAAPAMTTPQK